MEPSGRNNGQNYVQATFCFQHLCPMSLLVKENYKCDTRTENCEHSCPLVSAEFA